MKKIKGRRLTSSWIDDVAANYIRSGYSKTKWMQFAQSCIATGYYVYMYEAKKTVSKYLTVFNPINDKKYLVRFSNHAPNYRREVNKDCDFFVGKTNLSITNTQQAFAAAKESLGEGKEIIEYPEMAIIVATTSHVILQNEELPWD